MELDARLSKLAAVQLHPLVFATVSGAHLYGFPSPDSDWDLRGVHVLPAATLLALRQPPKDETIEYSADYAGLDADLVTHDVAKFMRMMLRRNGYVLEQLLSPLIVCTSPAHDELKRLAPACLTRNHANHYLGFARTQWHLFEKENPYRVKPLLYTYRVLLTGIHLMRAGEVEANLGILNAIYPQTGVADLIEAKTSGCEQETMDEGAVEMHRERILALTRELEDARDGSVLPDVPGADAEAALDAVLLRLRGSVVSGESRRV